MQRGHAEALPVMVKALIEKAGLAFPEVTKIVVTTGPGSFTGVRVGLSFANGLSQALNVAVHGIDVMTATQASVPKSEYPILVVHKSGESGLYHFLKSNNSTTIETMKLEDMVEELDSFSQQILGTGADDVMAAAPHIPFTRVNGHDLPEAQNFTKSALAYVTEKRFARPLYLRDPDAKIHKIAPDWLVQTSPVPDLANLASIHAESFPTPWGPDEIAALLSVGGTKLLTAGTPTKAFVLFRQTVDEAEILTLATTPSERRKGFGTSLMKFLIAALRSAKVKTLVLEVATNNAAALALYRQMGFKPAGRRKAYYDNRDGSRTDAEILKLSLA